MMPDPSFSIPEDLARRHAHQQPGESAADSAHRIGRSWARTFTEIGGLTGQARVLDIGCGPGRMAIAIGEQFGWTNPYVGFDVASADIDFCRTNITSAHPGFRFLHLDVRNHYYNPKGKMAPDTLEFPAEPGGSDFAFATSIFTHFFTAEFQRYVAETHRCLAATGGRFLSSYFLLDAESKAGMLAGKARVTFEHRIDEHAVAGSKMDLGKAVAYEWTFVREVLAEAGFVDIVHHRGSWSGLPGRHSQDIVVARKTR